jgi:hypothetical protein
MLIQRMDATLGIIQSMLDIPLACVRGMAAALGGLPADGSAESVLGSKKMSDTMDNAVLVNLLFTYRAASEQDLTTCIELYETPAFSRFKDRLQKPLWLASRVGQRRWGGK